MSYDAEISDGGNRRLHLAEQGLRFAFSVPDRMKTVAKPADWQKLYLTEISRCSAQLEAREVLHGIRVDDPYRHLEEVSSESVLAWIAANNEVCGLYFQRPERSRINQMLDALACREIRSTPTTRGDISTVHRFDPKTKTWTINATRDPQGTGTPVVICSPRDDGAAVRNSALSPGGRYLAFAIAARGRDPFWQVAAVPQGDLIEEHLPAFVTGLSWGSDDATIYYARLDDDEGSWTAAVLRHTIGQQSNADQICFSSTGPNPLSISPRMSADGIHLVLTINSLNQTANRIVVLAPNRPGREGVIDDGSSYWHYLGNDRAGRFFFITNKNAPMRCVVAIDPFAIHPLSTIEVIVPESDAVLETASFHGDKVAGSFLHDEGSRVWLFSTEGQPARRLQLGRPGRITGLDPQPGSQFTYYQHENPIAPRSIHRLDLSTEESREIFSPERRGAEVIVERFVCQSRDGQSIPVTIYHGASTKRDGTAAAVLSIYGGFNVISQTAYKPWVSAWVEAGGVFCTASVRGGGERGEQWHQAAVKGLKQATFDDTLAAAHWLISSGWAATARLGIMGHSNGGLTAAACTLQEPQIFRAVCLDAALLDMVRYAQLGVGWTWMSEYGSVEDETEFRALLSYSPYHCIKPDNYPAVLIRTALDDDIVHPAHSLKFAAALRAAQTGSHPILLSVSESRGHGAGRTAEQELDFATEQFMFFGAELGIEIC